MKLFKKIISIISIAILISSCKKDEFKATSLSSLKIVNTVTDGAAVRLGSLITEVGNNSSGNFALVAGNPEIYVWPVHDSLKPYYTSSGKSVKMADREMYTLFLGGDTNNVESILIRDDLPVHNDSTAGVRFINLASGSSPVKVTLSTSPEMNEFGDVQYKQITEFKSFPATSVNTAYTFEVRNASTDEIIASVTMSGSSLGSFVPRFRNVTLVLRGIVNGSPAAGITRVNHYPQ